jgi:splicing factor 3B subunit 4
MHGQYLMNKEVSVQYAYKKDGKGERHGDEAERLLAAQARKHNIQPQVQPLPPQAPGPGPAMLSSHGPNSEAPPRPTNANPTLDFTAGRGNGMGAAPILQHRSAPHASTMNAPPPAGLPARPPRSQGGYGGPQGFFPPGYDSANPPPNFASGGLPPNRGPPPNFGFSGPPAPSSLPPGFQLPGNVGTR